MRKYSWCLGRADRWVMLLLLGVAILAIVFYHSTASPKAEASDLATNKHTRADTIYSPEYVGPPQALRRGSASKFSKRQVLDLNRVDSLTLLRVPGIGPAFASRILALRTQLGGYYTVLQLQEVYGMDEDKFLALKGWFAIRTKPKQYPLDSLRADDLPRHPYLSWTQRKALSKLLYRQGRIASWRQLMRTEAFLRDDSVRLSPYFIELAPDSVARGE